MASAISLTLALAGLTTLVLLGVGVPLAWKLARIKGRWGEAVNALIALPLVLPPTVLGFYLLVLLGPHGPLAPLMRPLGLTTLAFSFPGLVIGSVVYSLPFMVQPVRAAFLALGEAPWEAALTLRAAPFDAFRAVMLPQIKGGLLTGAVLSFAHTLGEFGVVLMVGGDIPGRTEVLSILLFNDVETLNWGQANELAAGMAGVSFLVLLVMFLAGRRA
ncbi:molybdate ABC transporter permease subunit [Acidocella sp.]|uniref:molybdate ABC transporter permease subunit n=2 Tax=Acidocella sp. TaxID=50710 RepID=UPI00262002F4|nr:molybdate ABC transporter permease subunit [Acidocella sp.]